VLLVCAARLLEGEIGDEGSAKTMVGDIEGIASVIDVAGFSERVDSFLDPVAMTGADGEMTMGVLGRLEA